nr:MAG TPA: hypothetical protein [Caudoviricetes sp.]
MILQESFCLLLFLFLFCHELSRFVTGQCCFFIFGSMLNMQ